MNHQSNMINMAILNYMFCLLGFGIEMGHYQNDFQKYNIANGKYKNKKEQSHQRQSHFKKRERPKFVKTSRRGMRDDKYNDKPFAVRERKFHYRQTLYNNMQKPQVMFNLISINFGKLISFVFP